MKRFLVLPAIVGLTFLGTPASVPVHAADAKAVKLDKPQQDAADKLRAKGAAVMQIAADTDALAVNLGIVGKQATDADLELVKLLPKVTQLNLQNTGVTDAGLANVAGLTTLTHLHLNGTAVTDAGLASLKGLSNLEYLNLYNTAVTDAGVKNLEGLKKLRKLYLWQTKVTDGGAKALKTAVPEIYVNRGEELTLPPPPPTSKPAETGKPAAVATAADKKPVNDKCPVSGKEIDATKTVVYQGKTVAFCCDNCPKTFEANPAKFVGKIPALAAPAAAPAAKPADKKPADAKPGDAKAGADFDAEGFIKTWLVAGAFTFEGTAGEEIDAAHIAKEAELSPKVGDKVKVKDKELTWKKVTATDYFLDFNDLFKVEGETNVGGYAVTYVEAPEEVKDAVLMWSSNDQGKVYFNGKEVGKFTEGRTLDKDTDKAEGLTLKKGVNVVVLKVISEANNFQGCARFTTKEGKPIAGLKVKDAAK